MSENTPRGPVDPPDPESGASGTGESEPRPPSDRPTEPQRADEPAAAAPPAGPPSGGEGPPPIGRHGAPPPAGDGAEPRAASGTGPGAQPAPGGYGAPPPGGYAAQPPGGPGAPPPGGPGTPPPYGGGGAAGAGAASGGAAVPSGSFRVGEALGYAWRTFTGNALVWILFVLLLIVVGAVFNSGNITSYQEMLRDSGSLSYTTQMDTGLTFGGSLLGLIGAVLTGIIQGLGTNAALREASGVKPTFASLFQAPKLGMIVVAALLLTAAQFVGALLCGVGLLVVAVFAVFTYQGVIDKDQNAWDAFIASFKLVGRNFGAVFLLELALLGINILGAIPCGLGLLVTIPLSLIALAFAYRRLTGGPVMA
ncbi:hypothetical protein [Myceligenerans pegani]|uniref:Integral membrane protein n=1 Tax=Myceligenerans pegani TaxID=2776917 RepID=A0ABR9N2A1_9MICO|nr:hypothetical protein [Myceligenerans sp. TRM 65318]MBE1877774.1 hypothetical protein [Myceligenerans sp. TRM 65318]MBE3020045.1 hypothetical protein [Myceligenerans sp. TRM 65318]